MQTAVHVESLHEVKNIAVNQHTTVIGKVVAVDSAVKISSKKHPDGLTKQDCRNADSCGTCNSPPPPPPSQNKNCERLDALVKKTEAEHSFAEFRFFGAQISEHVIKHCPE